MKQQKVGRKETREYLLEKLPQRIKDARKEAGISQRELGIRAGVTGMSIHWYETGKSTPRVYAIIGIAVALDVSVGWLLGEELVAQ